MKDFIPLFASGVLFVAGAVAQAAADDYASDTTTTQAVATGAPAYDAGADESSVVTTTAAAGYQSAVASANKTTNQLEPTTYDAGMYTQG